VVAPARAGREQPTALIETATEACARATSAGVWTPFCSLRSDLDEAQSDLEQPLMGGEVAIGQHDQAWMQFNAAGQQRQAGVTGPRR
jgi:hypothetical protein